MINLIPAKHAAKLLTRKYLNKTTVVCNYHHPAIARRGRPGQFVQMLTARGLEPYLRRPMSIYATNPKAGTFSILFATVGTGTRLLATMPPGTEVPVLGPLGNMFTLPPRQRRVILVAGGVGLPPLDFWARRLAERRGKLAITLLSGVRSAVECIKLPRRRAVRHRWSTDDGSAGFPGTVIDLLQDLYHTESWSTSDTMLYGCGPPPMLRALQEWMLNQDFAGQLSLEGLMPCGFGVCSGCVVPSRANKTGYDRYRRVCYDGPIFDVNEVSL